MLVCNLKLTLSQGVFMEIDIGDLSHQTQISTATIRFYESKGLIKSIGRKGLRRQYPMHTCQTLALIKILQKGGMSLNEIQAVTIQDAKIKIDREIIPNIKIEIENRIDALNYLLVILSHVEKCPYQDHLNCPDFLKLLSAQHS